MNRKVFLSHCKADKPIVRRVAELLKTAGVPVFYDEWDIRPGEHIPAKIDEALTQRHVLVVFLSEDFYKSSWGPAEVYTQIMVNPLNTAGTIIPVRLDDAPIRPLLASLRYIDLRPSHFDAGIKELLDTCRDLTQFPAPDPTGHASLPISTPITPSDIPRIAIIGRGFAGTVTAIRLMQLASVKLELFMIEQDAEQIHGGLAYGNEYLGIEHFLNIHAGRISIYRERPDDFLKWATEDIDREGLLTNLGIDKDYHGEWDEHLKFTEYSAVPRLVYKLYLQDRFNDARKLAGSQVDLQEINGIVNDIDIVSGGDAVRIYYQIPPELGGLAPIKKELVVDVCILCTGHREPRLHDAAQDKEVLSYPSFFQHPYQREFFEALEGSKKEDSLLIIGTGLTAFDAAASASFRNFEGTITMCSRHAFTHSTYPQKHSHSILPRMCFDDLFPNVGCLTAAVMNDAIDAALSRARTYVFPKFFPEDHPSVIPERVYKAVEWHIKQFVDKAPREEVRQFLKERSKITTMRTSVVSAVSNLVWDKCIIPERRQITKFVKRTGSAISVHFAADEERPAQIIDFSHIVCCLGYEADYSVVKDGLWKNIMQKYALPHFKTGLGIAVYNNGKVERKRKSGDNEPFFRSLYAVGAMLQGDEIQRNGRLGAFTFSIGTIRNQALRTALSVLDRVELHGFRDTTMEKRRKHRDNIKGSQNVERFEGFASDLADIQFLPNVEIRNECLEFLREEVGRFAQNNERLPAEKALATHDLWHAARKRAGEIVTDISRLSERYAQVRSYRPGNEESCMIEKKQCKDFAKKLKEELNAQSVSVSVYSSDNRCLFPFVAHLRLNAFTPTPDGVGNAGRLVEAFKCKASKDELFERYFQPGEIDPCYSENRAVGMVIHKYNETSGKKDNYKYTRRIYEHVLAHLIVKDGDIVGMIYLEAIPSSRTFDVEDLAKVGERVNAIANVLFKVARVWQPTSIADYRDQQIDELSASEGKQFWNCNFTNARMEKLVATGVDFSLSNFTGTICAHCKFERSKFIGAKMVGPSMKSANFDFCDLSGCCVYGADFSEASLCHSTICGATVEHSSFCRAFIEDAIIYGGVFQDVNFARASFKKTVFRHVTLVRCHFPESWANWGNNNPFINCTADVWTINTLPDSFRAGFKVIEDRPSR